MTSRLAAALLVLLIAGITMAAGITAIDHHSTRVAQGCYSATFAIDCDAVLDLSHIDDLRGQSDAVVASVDVEVVAVFRD